MSDRITASVTLHLTISDPAVVWNRAATQAIADGLGKTIEDIRADTGGVLSMIGTEDDPDLSGCLRMIFDPGESGDGLQIEDSSAEVDYPEDEEELEQHREAADAYFRERAAESDPFT